MLYSHAVCFHHIVFGRIHFYIVTFLTCPLFESCFFYPVQWQNWWFQIWLHEIVSICDGAYYMQLEVIILQGICTAWCLILISLATSHLYSYAVRKGTPDMTNWSTLEYRCVYGAIMMQISLVNVIICDDIMNTERCTLWPSDAIWRHRSMSTLAQVMACCLTAPNHYLNQCWLMISEVLWHSPDSNFTEITSDIYRWNEFEIY